MTPELVVAHPPQSSLAPDETRWEGAEIVECVAIHQDLGQFA